MNLAQGLPALGAHLHTQDGQRGVRFAVWAPQADGVEVCLFDTATGPETRRIALTDAGNGVWQAFVPGLADDAKPASADKEQDDEIAQLRNEQPAVGHRARCAKHRANGSRVRRGPLPASRVG